MVEFPTVPLGHVARLLSGGTPSKTEPSFWSGSIPWLTPKDMGKWDGSTEEAVSRAAIGNGTRLAPEGAVFIVVRGMSLHNEIRIVRSNAAITFNQDIKAIVPKDGVDGRFLYYALTAKKAELLESVEAAGHGTGRIPTDRLQSLGVPAVSPAEQTAISSCLGAFDDKIDLNSHMNETLETIARAVFKDWFVDFGPTRTKMEGRAPYLAPKIWALFPDRLDEEGKPNGWELVPACDMIEFNPSERLARGEAAPYLDMATLPTSGSWAGAPISREFASGSKFRNGDALLARITPCLENGKAAFVQNLDDGAIGWGSTEFIVMRARPPMPSAYAYMVARDNAFKERAVQSMTGTSGRQRVQQDSLAEFFLNRPSHEVAKAFAEFVSPCFTRVAANARESQTLAASRDLLLPKLMSGEIRVSEAETLAKQTALA